MKRIAAMLALASVFAIAVRGQGFLNLNFESAYNLPGSPPGAGVPISVTNALPGWSAYDDTLLLSDVYYVSNNSPGSSSSVELEGGSLALSGNLSVGLYLEGSISQTGLVPENAESLEFAAEGRGAGGSIEATDLSVTLGGQNLAYTLLSVDTGYSVYGANIPSDLDGQMEALVFGCQGVGSGNVLLDNIEFLPTSVPEPGKGALFGLGAVLFGVSRRRARLRRGMGGGI